MYSDELKKFVENDSEKLWIEGVLITRIFENSEVKVRTENVAVSLAKSLRPSHFIVYDYSVEDSVKGYKVSATAKAMYDIPSRMLEVCMNISAIVSNTIADNTTVSFTIAD